VVTDAPGGRIDSFTWKWTWGGAKTGDSATRTDRFLLRRPRAARSKFGGFSLGPTEPLPGIDGSGVLCLTIRGVRTNAITGHLDPFVSQQKCERYGVYLALPNGPGAIRNGLTEQELPRARHHASAYDNDSPLHAEARDCKACTADVCL